MDSRYKDRFYKFIIDLEPYVQVDFDKIVKKQNKSEFIEMIKEFIRFDNGKHLGFQLEISSDYTSFRKINEQCFKRVDEIHHTSTKHGGVSNLEEQYCWSV